MGRKISKTLWKGSLTHTSTYHFRGFYSTTFTRSEVLTSFLNSRSRLFLPVSSVVNIFLQILGLYRNWSQSRDPGKLFNASNSRFHTAYVASVFSLNKLDLAPMDSCRERVFYFILFLYSCLLPISLKSGHFDIFPFPRLVASYSTD